MPGTHADLTDIVRDAGGAKAAERGLEVKSANYGTKVLDAEQGIAEMIVAVTGIEDHVNDIIEPGAIGPGLKSRWPKGIWHHTWEQPICKTLEAEELMPGDKRLPGTLRDSTPWPSEAGAFLVKGQFNLETQRGREAFSDIKFFGADQEYSIGYKVGKATRTKDGVRHIKSMTIPEYSPVLFGAMPSTSTLSTKDAMFGTDAAEKSGFVNLPGSLEERLDSIEDAIEAMLPGQGIDLAKSAVRVVGTYDDRVVFAISDDEKAEVESFFEAPYFVKEDGSMIVSVPHAVDVSKRESEKSDDPLVAALELAGELTEQVKSGRPLSGANAAKVRAASVALAGVLTEAKVEFTLDDVKADEDLDAAMAAITEVKQAFVEGKYSPDQQRDSNGKWGSGGGGGSSPSGSGAGGKFTGSGGRTQLSADHRSLLSKAHDAIGRVLIGTAGMQAMAGGVPPDAGRFTPKTKAEFVSALQSLDEADSFTETKALLIELGETKGWSDELPEAWQSEAKASAMAKRPHDFKAGDDGKCATCGSGSGNPMHHVKADGDKPHPFVPSDDDKTKCAICGEASDAPCHSTKADPGHGGADPTTGGPDWKTHEYQADSKGYCTTCGRVKGSHIHDLPYGQEYHGPIDRVASNMHGNKADVTVSAIELLEMERARAGV